MWTESTYSWHTTSLFCGNNRITDANAFCKGEWLKVVCTGSWQTETHSGARHSISWLVEQQRAGSFAKLVKQYGTVGRQHTLLFYQQLRSGHRYEQYHHERLTLWDSGFIHTTNVCSDCTSNMKTRWQLPNCIGSIDGKHILIECPANSGSRNYNYKVSVSSSLLSAMHSIGETNQRNIKRNLSARLKIGRRGSIHLSPLANFAASMSTRLAIFEGSHRPDLLAWVAYFWKRKYSTCIFSGYHLCT